MGRGFSLLFRPFYVDKHHFITYNRKRTPTGWRVRKERFVMLKMPDGRSVYRAMFSLAIPISLQNLITFAVNFADNLMVGTLRDTAISAVYMGTQVQTFLSMMINGLSAAMLILIAQYWGKRDLDSIRRIASIAMRAGLTIGLLLTVASVGFARPILQLLTPDQAVVQAAIPYLQITGFSCLFFAVSQITIAMMRGVENARVGMYISAFALLVNVTLNYVFIFGLGPLPAMGVNGAAIATLISRVFEAAAAVWYMLRCEKVLCWRFSCLFMKCGVLVRDFVRYGGPVMAGDLVWSINTFCQSMIIGRLMKEAITAASIMNQMNNLVFIWISGLSAAVGILTGILVGAGETEKIRPYARLVQLTFLAVGVCSCGVILLLKGPFLSLYNITPASQTIADQMMTLLSVTFIGTCYQASGLAGLVKAGGDTSFVFKNDTLFVFLVVLPSGFAALTLGAPAWVVMACLKCDQILKCIVAVVKINRFNWMKNVTRPSHAA